MKRTFTIIELIPWAAAIVFGMLLFSNTFSGCKKPVDRSAEVQIWQQVAKEAQEDRDYYRGKYDSALAISKKEDVGLKNQYQATKVVYEKIPVIINDFDREQLRRAVTGYQAGQ